MYIKNNNNTIFLRIYYNFFGVVLKAAIIFWQQFWNYCCRWFHLLFFSFLYFIF